MVIENLLDNASKYSPSKSTITIRLESDQNKIRIHVTDKGVGIAKKDLSKLFKKFSRIQNELSDNITGSGLGLYWVREIMALHGGRVTVTSQKGSGAPLAWKFHASTRSQTLFATIKLCINLNKI